MEILGGPLFGVAGAGESHGPAVTTIVFGCPPGVQLSREAVQQYLDRRRPGSNKHGTPRHEGDKVIFTAGIFDDDHDALLSGPQISVEVDGTGSSTVSYEAGYSTGEPIAALVLSTSSKSGHYSQFSGERGEVRPGHTDLVKHHKSRSFVDYRGGGRSSYRSAISDVVGGSVARLFLQQQFDTLILSSISQVGPLKAETHLSDLLNKDTTLEEAEALRKTMADAVIYSADTGFAAEAGDLIKETRKAGNSLGAVVEVVALNVPALIG